MSMGSTMRGGGGWVKVEGWRLYAVARGEDVGRMSDEIKCELRRPATAPYWRGVTGGGLLEDGYWVGLGVGCDEGRTTTGGVALAGGGLRPVPPCN